MDHDPSPTLPQSSPMDSFTPLADDPSSVWDWAGLMDFASPPAIFDDSGLPTSLVSPDPPRQPEIPPGSVRVRKRDPRLTCSNFLAGRVPCACPEMDAQLMEEEEAARQGKKRPRTAASEVRCQVPGCEADIRELKGYHRRHRVCLVCANAESVVLDGQCTRYCQQCGKFHILSDFDKGKRSCRRKLERHNNRRRRKSNGLKDSVEKASEGDTLAEITNCHDEVEKDLCLNSEVAETEKLLKPEDTQPSTLFSATESQNIQDEFITSRVASGSAPVDKELENSFFNISSMYSENKSAYSSVCPTGRISFKLYDWNPAEFPRRLRHQIFQWLSSMPIELEGYIRPGCTILTTFIAMPPLMWLKLFKDPTLCLHDFVVAPGGMLSRKGNFFVYMNDMIFHVTKDGTSITKVNQEMRAPRLHYVDPICFESGCPIKFVACGSNLDQTKFRFIISFAGKYLAYENCVAVSHCETQRDSDRSFELQFYKISIPHTEPDIFGPAFIEVENEFGLSNFLPILIGNGGVCSEVKRLQLNIDASVCSKGSSLLATAFLSNSCEDSVLHQTSISEFILDIGWLLREPASENVQPHLTSSKIQRVSCLLNYLLQNECFTLLERILHYAEILMAQVELKRNFYKVDDNDKRLFQTCLDQARDIHQKLQKRGDSRLDSRNYASGGDCLSLSCSVNDSLFPVTNQGLKVIKEGKFEAACDFASGKRSAAIPLVNKEIVMDVKPINEWPRQSCGQIFTSKTIRFRRHLVFAVATVATCIGLCTIIYHPQRVSDLMVTIGRCIFDGA